MRFQKFQKGSKKIKKIGTSHLEHFRAFYICVIILLLLFTSRLLKFQKKTHKKKISEKGKAMTPFHKTNSYEFNFIFGTFGTYTIFFK